jgi:demethylmenaquinone methyltransferase/2-methoxy-6-polyprenyl-1,4-benzoquinol methylase
VGSARTAHARRLFDGIAPAYDAPAEIFSFGQYGRWRRFAVSKIDARPGSVILDVATGTGLVARDLRRRGLRVIGLDQSDGMLVRTSRRGVAAVGGSAERLPFGDETFDALTFTYLLRYVDDPASTLAELARVARRGGVIASVEFGLPDARWARRLWNIYALRVMPLAMRPLSRGWRDVGDFLGPSIVDWAGRFPSEALIRLWEDAGLRDVGARAMSFGAGVVMWARKA